MHIHSILAQGCAFKIAKACTRSGYRQQCKCMSRFSLVWSQKMNNPFISRSHYNSLRPSQVNLLENKTGHIKISIRNESNVVDSSLLSPPQKSFDTFRMWHDPNFMEGKSAEEKEAWLQSLLNDDDLYEKVDTLAFHIVLDAWSYSESNGFPQKTEFWISRMEEHHAKLVALKIDLNHAKQIFDEMMGKDVDYSPLIFWSETQPNVTSYNAVIRAWSRSKDEIAIVRAERWFNKIHQLAKHFSTNLKLNSTHSQYDSILNNEEGTGSILKGPNTESFNLFLKTCSRGQSKKGEIRVNNAFKAEKILDLMTKEHTKKRNEHIVPNTESFNYVLSAWTKCTKDPSMAERIMDHLRAMEAFHRDVEDPESVVVRPNTASYSTAMNAWGIVAAQKATLFHKKKQKHTFDRFMKDLDERNSQNGYKEVTNAEDILNYMHELYKAGHPSVCPDTSAYNCLIKCWANISNPQNKDAPLKAEQVLRQMIEFQNNQILDIAPDYLSYGMIIHAWSKLNLPNSAKRAHWWLEQMKNEYRMERRESLKPNAFAYNSVIKAYSQIRDPDNVDTVLNELIDIEAYEDTTIGPNTESFALAIRAWYQHETYCSVRDAGYGYLQAYFWLNEIVEREKKGHPGITTTPELYNNVLKAAKVSQCSNIDVLEIAKETFLKFRESRHHLDWYSYKWLIEIGIKVLSADPYDVKRSQFIEMVNAKCCEDGLLTQDLVNILQNKMNKQLCKRVLGDWPFPKNWSRNLHDERMIPTKYKWQKLEDQ